MGPKGKTVSDDSGVCPVCECRPGAVCDHDCHDTQSWDDIENVDLWVDEDGGIIIVDSDEEDEWT